MNIDVLSKSQISTDEKFHRKCCIIHRRFSRVFIDDKSILDTMVNHLTIDENNKMIDVRSKTISMSEEIVQIA